VGRNLQGVVSRSASIGVTRTVSVCSANVAFQKTLLFQSEVRDIPSKSWKLRIFLYLLIYGAGAEPTPLLLRQFIGLLYQPWVTDGDDHGAVSGMNE
jgi:hypothetical protein